MSNPIIEFLSRYIDLTDEEVHLLSKENNVKKYPKDHLLLEKDEIAKNCYFVLKGCVRSYYLIDGEEKITEFFTEMGL